MSDQDAGPLVNALRATADRFPRSTPLRAPARLTHVDSVLFGGRGLYRPSVALQTIQRLGPARHAIAQRTVAGMIEVHAPWAPKPDPSAKDAKSATRQAPPVSARR